MLRGLSRSRRESLILEVAGRVFADGGYERASMDRIADLAGMSKPLLYAHFGSKQGLYLAYVEGTGAELMGALMRADSADDDGAARLRSVVVQFLDFVDAHREGWLVLFHELTASRPVAGQVAAVRARIVDEVRRMLEGEERLPGVPAPEPGALRAPASEAMAEAIVGAGEALANWWLMHPDVARDDVADWYVGLVRTAIAAAHPPETDPNPRPA